ncbi:PAS domain-containing protein [Rhodobacter capsulatus]|uniref:PAS domain-containing protein n=1 Tax=Rhodobacter capsulatus TaxID=1061 RepID=UPI004038A4FA
MTLQNDPSRHAEGAVDFGFDEVFFSRTDKRGVILAGNDVFQRVSGYGWGDLLGAPHKIIRHPDTPRAVFRILWDALGNGHPMGGYVKNRARNGDHYWVFGVILPMDGGYLSVRLKPSSPLFDKVRALYADLCTRERVEGLDPEASARMLWHAVTEAGFTSYTTFMASALGQELAARDIRMRRPVDPRTQRLIDLNVALEQVTQEQRKLLRSFESLQSIPNNMRLVASRLEPSGGPVSAISENYRASSLVISERLRSFVTGRDNLCDRVSRQAARALFLLGADRVLGEMISRFRHAEPVAGIDWAAEGAGLERLRASGREDSRVALKKRGRPCRGTDPVQLGNPPSDAGARHDPGDGAGGMRPVARQWRRAGGDDRSARSVPCRNQDPAGNDPAPVRGNRLRDEPLCQHRIRRRREALIRRFALRMPQSRDLLSQPGFALRAGCPRTDPESGRAR